ncbi:FAD-dependent monooxygenase [Nocardia asiatica]|uniref:FAD-dependent monooxygenase n=1 Tax=Nocardia asiatica TaxID=209252 RepID=UPI0002E73D02
MVSHLLAAAGIANIVIDLRTRVRSSVRNGVLEGGNVRMLFEAGVSDRVLRDGQERRGIRLRFEGADHRIEFEDSVGRRLRGWAAARRGPGKGHSLR